MCIASAFTYAPNQHVGWPGVLKQRIITALCLAPIVIAAIVLLPLPAFAAVFAIVVAIAATEWATLANLAGTVQKGAYAAAVLVVCALIWWLGAFDGATAVAALFWLAGTAVVLRYPASGAVITPASLTVTGLVLLPGVWAALVAIRTLPDGGAWLLWSFVLVWGADIGAYFAGRAFGRHKLAPRVSPGKTWEGVLGGAALSALVAGALLIAFAPDLRALWLIPGLIAVSVIGDLFESALKRETGVKDSGGLLPGHGGVLDRIDSLLAVVPVFAALGVLARSGSA